MKPIPFNLEAFKNGAIAITSTGVEATFVKMEGEDRFAMSIPGKKGTDLSSSIAWAVGNWTMKPTPLDDWIAVINNKYPIDIPEGEGQKKLMDGTILDLCGSYMKGSTCTPATIAVRLRNRQAAAVTKEKEPEIEKKGIQTITEKEVKELQERLLPQKSYRSNSIQNAFYDFKYGSEEKGSTVKCDIIGSLMK